MDIDININHTRSTLLWLNKELQKKCGNSLTMEFGNYEQIISIKEKVALYDKDKNSGFQLLLCLNKNTSCIATISCKINKDGSMEISSKTDPTHEGRKYNLLLRCAIVLLASSIFITKTRKVTSIVSRAINPISILLMAKYFGATNHELEKFIENNGLSYEALTLENMQNFYDELNEIPEFETEEEEMLYLENLKSFGNPVLLSIDVNNPYIINKTKQLYSQLVIRCPDVIGGKTKKRTKKGMKREKHKIIKNKTIKRKKIKRKTIKRKTIKRKS